LSYGHAENYLKIENVKVIVYLGRKHYILTLTGGEMLRFHSFEKKIMRTNFHLYNVAMLGILAS